VSRPVVDHAEAGRPIPEIPVVFHVTAEIPGQLFVPNVGWNTGIEILILSQLIPGGIDLILALVGTVLLGLIDSCVQGFLKQTATLRHFIFCVALVGNCPGRIRRPQNQDRGQHQGQNRGGHASVHHHSLLPGWGLPGSASSRIAPGG
jgi:hypothetical protein